MDGEVPSSGSRQLRAACFGAWLRCELRSMKLRIIQWSPLSKPRRGGPQISYCALIRIAFNQIATVEFSLRCHQRRRKCIQKHQGATEHCAPGAHRRPPAPHQHPSHPTPSSVPAHTGQLGSLTSARCVEKVSPTRPAVRVDGESRCWVQEEEEEKEEEEKIREWSEERGGLLADPLRGFCELLLPVAPVSGKNWSRTPAWHP